MGRGGWGRDEEGGVLRGCRAVVDIGETRAGGREELMAWIWESAIVRFTGFGVGGARLVFLEE